MIMFITLGISILVSAIILIRHRASARNLAPHPVVIRTTPRRRR